MTACPSAVSPTAWNETLTDAPVLDRAVRSVVPALVRRWQDIAPDIDQAALDHHFIAIHLGGAKRLSRQGEGAALTRDVPCGAYSIVPAGSAFRWDTQGPVDFVHVYFEPAVLDHVVAGAFDRDPSSVTLGEGLGLDDRLIGSLTSSLLTALESEDQHQAYLDDILHLLLCRMLLLHSNVAASTEQPQYALAPFRLRRAIEFVDASLAEPIGVAEIAAACGVSPYHFSRAFRRSTGRPPYAYLVERRIAAARAMLDAGALSLSDIAAQCGFGTLSQFSRTFRRETGMTATRYRNRH